jgi:putative ABC transport system ATP-binding protein
MPRDSEPVLEIDHVTKSYVGKDGIVDALASTSLELYPGELLVVRGPSGSGKTTLLLVAAGLLRPDSGSVKIDGTDIYQLSNDERARKRAATIGFVFQQFHLIPYLTVEGNVLSPLLALPRSERLAHENAHDRASALIEEFGLTKRIGHRTSQLSTGEKQRVALARALLLEPRLILADEPTGNLDNANAAIVLDRLARFASAGGAVLLVTHDPAAIEHATRSLDLVDGRLVDVR